MFQLSNAVRRSWALNFLYLTFTDFSQLAELEGFKDKYDLFANGEVSLRFRVPFQWSVQDISNYVSTWLVSDGQVDHFSMVGVMSSTEFASVITNCLGKGLAANFKALMVSTSALRISSGSSKQDLAEFSFVADYACFQILNQLEKHIASRKFKLSRPTQLGLFLVLVGSIIATKYYQDFVQVTTYRSFISSSPI